MPERSIGKGTLAPPGSKADGDFIARASDALPLERIEARFSGRGYEMHRHDTYAIGRTLLGVQSFHYRGSVRSSLPGETLVLHPDEPHDGQAGADGGFRYRMIYIEPAAIQAVLGGRPLPFISGGISGDPRLVLASNRLLRPVGERLERLAIEDAMVDLARALVLAAGGRMGRRRALTDPRSVMLARDYLMSLPGDASMAQLEAITGQDRSRLTRDFGCLMGTSPYRFLVMRRLDAAKAAMLAGRPLAEAALEAGFCDQSHMTRHFKWAFGTSPGRWLALVGTLH